MALILLYHRVGTTGPDPWALNVAPAHFEQHLCVVRERLRPLSLEELLAAMADGAPVDDAVAVTFDDGYADNLHAALPLLEHHGIPATFFIPSAAIDAVREFWWDELEALILGPAELPSELRISFPGDAFAWKLGAATRLRPDELVAPGWVAWEAPPTSRHALFVELWTRCHALSAAAREDVLHQIRAWAGIAPLRAERRTLSLHELGTLAASPFAHIGGHTITHPSLSSLPITEQRHEIAEGRSRLERLVGRSVESFSYPFGKPTDYSPETVVLVRDAGYRSACANVQGVVRRGTDPFQWPRLFVRDMDGPSFSAWLSSELVAREETASWAARRVTTSGAPILDLGGFTAALPPHVAPRLTSVRSPLADRSLGYARAGGSEAPAGSGLPFDAGRFGFVLAGEDVAVAAGDPAAFVGEVLRVLEPGGRFLLKLCRARDADLWRWNRGRLIATSREVGDGVVLHELAAPDTRHVATRLPVALGELRRLEPVSRQFGFDRGLPIDRYYIEKFLSSHASDIHGAVLEIGDDAYTWRFGGDRVTTSDVLHVVEGNPRATVVGDLAEPAGLPGERFDCIICTQTIHLIFDLPAAVKSLRQMLKPGGVLLATCPGISQLAGDRWRETWHWSLTPLSARRLFDEQFGESSADVASHGNVFASVAFLHGLAAEELTDEELTRVDPLYPLLVTIRAERPRRPGITGLEIVAVSRPGLDAAVAGAYVDVPAEGQVVQARAVPVRGWVVGRDAPIRVVQISAAGVPDVTAAVEGVRPDVHAHLPAHGWSASSGFETQLNLAEWPGGTLRLTALTADDEWLELGTITARRTWREGTHRAEHDVVSVIIPCFNQGHYIADAIESVLAQTYPHVEVVVIDDGSTDNSATIAARYPGVRCIRQPNRGLAAARNEGIRRSSGNLLVFLDADDTLERDGLAHGVACLREHPDAAFAYGRFRFTDAGDGPFPVDNQARLGADAYENLLRGNHICMHAAVLYRRAAFQIVEGFDEGLPVAEDYDLYLRIARQLPIASHAHVVARYRRHDASMSTDAGKMLRWTLDILGRQRPFVRRTRSRRTAYRDGVRHWRHVYAPLLLTRIRRDLAGRTVSASTLRNLWTLSRYAPEKLLPTLGLRSHDANAQIIARAERVAPSYTSVVERNELCDLARAVRQNGLIVEVGGLYGGVTAVLGLSNPLARIVVIDDFSWSPLPGMEASASLLLIHCSRLGVTNVSVNTGDSREIGETWNEPIDLLWIDGGHDYDVVMSDLRKFGPHSTRVAVHGWDNSERPGVRLAVEEFLKENPQWRFSHSVATVVVLERSS